MLKRNRVIDALVLAAIVALTMSTAYIHFWVGGILLLLNAAGYVTLAGAVLGATVLYRRVLPLVLAGLAAYAAVTIAGWLVMGPYFDVAYVAKGIELTLIALIGLALARSWSETRAAFAWALASARAVALRAAGRPIGGAAPTVPGDE